MMYDEDDLPGQCHHSGVCIVPAVRSLLSRLLFSQSVGSMGHDLVVHFIGWVISAGQASIPQMSTYPPITVWFPGSQTFPMKQSQTTDGTCNLLLCLPPVMCLPRWCGIGCAETSIRMCHCVRCSCPQRPAGPSVVMQLRSLLWHLQMPPAPSTRAEVFS